MSWVFARYTKFLKEKPYLANSISTGLLIGSGDILAQLLVPPKDGSKYNFKRTFRAIVYGSIVFAPMADPWYKFLQAIEVPSRFIPRLMNPKPINLVARVAVDQLLFAPFIGIPLYFSIMPMLELNFDRAYIVKKVKENWKPTLLANWSVWPAFQMFNFYMVPVHYRLNAVNIFSIGWNTFLSYTLHKDTPIIQPMD